MNPFEPLPVELLDQIIDTLVITVGIYKAVRLRLVNRTCDPYPLKGSTADGSIVVQVLSIQPSTAPSVAARS